MQGLNRKISVVIPAYNKSQVILPALQNILTHLKLETENFEIILVNNGSTDNTIEKAREFKKFNGDADKIRVYNLGQNCGKGAALCFGFEKTTGDIVIFADGCWQLPARNLRVALAYLDQTAADIVLGSKRHPHSLVEYPLNLRFFSWCYQTLNRFLFNLNVADTQVGLKVFKREALEAVMYKIGVGEAAFDLELLIVAKSAGFSKIFEFPIEIKNQIDLPINWKVVRNILVNTLGIFWRKAILGYYEEKSTKHLEPLLLSRPKKLNTLQAASPRD